VSRIMNPARTGGLPHTSELQGLETRFGKAFVEIEEATREILGDARTLAANGEKAADYRDIGGLLVFAHWLREYGERLGDLGDRLTLATHELAVPTTPTRVARLSDS
jgi:hypothetical protein